MFIDQFGAEAVPLFVEGATHFTEKRDDISFDPGTWICVNELYFITLHL